jgi:secreted PhoX family phosphatase
MTDKNNLTVSGSNDVVCNDSDNVSFQTVLGGFLSRRDMLKGGVGSAATLLMGSGLAACGFDKPPTPTAATPTPVPVLQLTFNAVAHSTADALVVPAGYTAKAIYALGDPLAPGVDAFRNDGSETGASFAFRAGDHHDGMAWFGLGSGGAADPTSNTRGLIAINHENITQVYLHPSGPTAAPRPANEALKEINAHGVAIFEVSKGANGWAVVPGSGFNRRITPNTWMQIAGPASGHPILRTLNSASGTMSRGTLNNCASGPTPWGTYLTCEENWADYFYRPPTTDDVARGATTKAVKSLTRYGVTSTTGSYQWRTAVATDPSDWTFRHWDATRSGTTVDGSDDFRNEPFTFGYVVEIDPFRPQSTPVKRTALGRFRHECAAYRRPTAGKPVVFYMGDDQVNDYVYKFVSDASWADADFGAGLAAGDKYLNAGKLYVAKFNADGTGNWLLLSLANPLVGASSFGFTEEAEVYIHTRLAADAVGATKMDRPEWTAVNPKNGDVYLTLTNNSTRTVNLVDAANPRAYDATGGTNRNVNGHIIRLAETGGEGAATAFTWDIYLFGAPNTADAANINVSGLTAANDFSSPDGIWFDTQGVAWIQTDDGAYTGTTNCMMLAAIPGTVGDGAAKTITNNPAAGTSTVSTRVGAAPTASNLKRFLVGPKGCEITGITATPDLKTLFVNIQHPGESGTLAALQSSWPAAAGSSARPRSATVVITKDDGGTVGGSLA